MAVFAARPEVGVVGTAAFSDEPPVWADLPSGPQTVIDLSLDDEVWDALGTAGKPEAADGAPFGAQDATTHPQYHLKLLLNRMGVSRGEVQTWHRAGLAASPPERGRAISNLFLPPSASARWVDLPADRRRLAGVRLMESAHPGEESQAIAVLIREVVVEEEEAAADESPLHQFEPLVNQAPEPTDNRSLDLLADVEMGVTAELGRTRMTVRELLALTPGSVVELDRMAGSPVDVLVNGTLVARGEVVVIDEEFGVRISEIIGLETTRPRTRA